MKLQQRQFSGLYFRLRGYWAQNVGIKRRDEILLRYKCRWIQE